MKKKWNCLNFLLVEIEMKTCMNISIVENGESAWKILEVNGMHLKVNTHLLKVKNGFESRLDVKCHVKIFCQIYTWGNVEFLCCWKKFSFMFTFKCTNFFCLCLLLVVTYFLVSLRRCGWCQIFFERFCGARGWFNCFLYTTFVFFRILTEKFINLRQNFFLWVVEASLYVSGGISHSWNKFLIHFCNLIAQWATKNRPSEKLLHQVSQKTAFYVSKATFSKNTAFMKKSSSISFRKQSKRFWILAEKFWHCFLDCTVRVHSNV